MNSQGNRLNLSNRFPVQPLLFFYSLRWRVKTQGALLQCWHYEGFHAIWYDDWLVHNLYIFLIHSLQMSTVHENNRKIWLFFLSLSEGKKLRMQRFFFQCSLKQANAKLDYSVCVFAAVICCSVRRDATGNFHQTRQLAKWAGDVLYKEWPGENASGKQNRQGECIFIRV